MLNGFNSNGIWIVVEYVIEFGKEYSYVVGVLIVIVDIMKLIDVDSYVIVFYIFKVNDDVMMGSWVVYLEFIGIILVNKLLININNIDVN